jgi:hypothetical protein
LNLGDWLTRQTDKSKLLGITNLGVIDLNATRWHRQIYLVSFNTCLYSLGCSNTLRTVDALTHLNYAFAYIDPKSFEIVTMDQQTPEALFQTVVDVKSLKPGLQVWISVGGWTFSDNGTAT